MEIPFRNRIEKLDLKNKLTKVRMKQDFQLSIFITYMRDIN